MCVDIHHKEIVHLI